MYSVIVGTLTPTEAFAAIQSEALALLFGMMVLVEYLKDDSVFDKMLDRFIVHNTSLTPTRLLWILSAITASSAALFTNDTMCIALTQIICRICDQRGYHPGPHMVTIAMSANIGSAATLIGNPQNVIIAALSGMPFGMFFFYSVAAAAVCLVVNTLALSYWYADELTEMVFVPTDDKEETEMASQYGAVESGGSFEMLDETSPLKPMQQHNDMALVRKLSQITRQTTLSDTNSTVSKSIESVETTVDLERGNKVCCFGPFSSEINRTTFRYAFAITVVSTLGGFLLNALPLGLTATAGGCVCFALDSIINRKSPERIFARVNWELLVFFAALFIIIQGLQATQIPSQLLTVVVPMMKVTTLSGVVTFTAVVTVACNIFNNVPTVLLMGLATVGTSSPELVMEVLGQQQLAWILLAWVSTVAGNLTLMGSVANLIVAEEGKKYFELSFGYYSSFGFPITLVTLYLGVAIICGMWVVMTAL